MNKKLITIIIISFIACISNTKNCYALQDIMAVNAVRTAVEDAVSNQEKSNAIRDWIGKNTNLSGFIYDFAEVTPTYQTILSCLPDSVKNGLGNNPTEEQVLDATKNFILNNQTVSNNQIVNDNDINTFIKNNVSNYEDTTGYKIGYSFDLTRNAQKFSSAAMLEALKQSVSGVHYPNWYCVWSSGTSMCKVPKNNYSFLVTNNSNSNFYICTIYSNDSWTTTPDTGDYEKYSWNANNGDYTTDNSLYRSQLAGLYIGKTKDDQGSIGNPLIMTNGNYEIPVYTSLNSLKQYSVGQKPYYYNNDVWQDFSTSSNGYTWSPTNINTVTYGDVTNYVNDYHDTNNNYPDNSTVNNWIEETNTENITNNGGGSGGNGGGSGSGSDGIFDFLSDLGSVLGNLISNLGQAITNIIKGISDLVTSIVTDLPTVFFDFIGAIFGWLPEEWVTLLSLSLAAMLIWGIVKVIRG